MKRFPALGSACLLAALLLSACSMPRVAVMDDPLTAQEHLRLGHSYTARGEHSLAENEYNEASDEIPEALLFRADALFMSGKLGAAETAYEKAIRALPNDPRPLNNLAWLYLTKCEKLSRAQELAERAVALEGDGPSAASYRDTLEKVRAARAAAL